MKSMEDEVQKHLFMMQDKKYQAFQIKLMPTVKPETVIGVRIPALRKYAAELLKLPEEAMEFLRILPHRYYEENNLHAFLIEKIKDFGLAVRSVDTFLPYIDNWATCDTMKPEVFSNHRLELYGKIREWMNLPYPYAVRFGIGMLMEFYLDADFQPEMLDLVAGIQSQEYYVNTMIAWYFATALAKQYDAALPYLENRKLDRWTHNKTIQKAIESFRLSSRQKDYLRTLRIRKQAKPCTPLK